MVWCCIGSLRSISTRAGYRNRIPFGTYRCFSGDRPDGFSRREPCDGCQRDATDLRRARGIDARPVVAGAMVVGVKASEKLQGWNAFAFERVVVRRASAISLLKVVEPQHGQRSQFVDDQLESRMAFDAADQDSPLGAADHVEIDHRHRLGQSDWHMRYVVLRAQQAEFLPGKCDEYHRPSEGSSVPRGCVRHLDHERRPRGVIVRAVVD